MVKLKKLEFPGDLVVYYRPMFNGQHTFDDELYEKGLPLEHPSTANIPYKKPVLKRTGFLIIKNI